MTHDLQQESTWATFKANIEQSHTVIVLLRCTKRLPTSNLLTTVATQEQTDQFCPGWSTQNDAEDNRRYAKFQHTAKGEAAKEIIFKLTGITCTSGSWSPEADNKKEDKALCYFALPIMKIPGGVTGKVGHEKMEKISQDILRAINSYSAKTQLTEPTWNLIVTMKLLEVGPS